MAVELLAMTDAELNAKTQAMVDRLRRLKSERAAVGNDLSLHKRHLANLHRIVPEMRYDAGCGELVVATSQPQQCPFDTVDPWPTYEDLKRTMREYARLNAEVKELQKHLVEAIGFDKDLLT